MIRFIFVQRKQAKPRKGSGISERAIFGVGCLVSTALIYPAFADGEPLIASSFVFAAICTGYAAIFSK
ncbi:hypothetical protein ACFSUD_19140 [Sulfitobacter aestuarii]|uniref:Uncharacterized protein n=1 Tax=Sulfitobacter aestuarii TaxID=2161676 RepID=A0ABW5U8R1_9RHOB